MRQRQEARQLSPPQVRVFSRRPPSSSVVSEDPRPSRDTTDVPSTGNGYGAAQSGLHGLVHGDEPPHVAPRPEALARPLDQPLPLGATLSGVVQEAPHRLRAAVGFAPRQAAL